MKTKIFKEASVRRLYNAWFQLRGILEETKSWQRLPGVEGREINTEVRYRTPGGLPVPAAVSGALYNRCVFPPGIFIQEWLCLQGVRGGWETLCLVFNFTVNLNCLKKKTKQQEQNTTKSGWVWLHTHLILILGDKRISVNLRSVYSI